MKPPHRPPRAVVRVSALLLALGLVAWGTAAQAQEYGPYGLHSDTQGPVYHVSEVSLEYAREHPSHVSIEQLMQVELALGETSDGYVGPRRGANNAWFRLADLGGDPIRIYAAGLRELNEQLVRELNRRGLIGVYVAPHEQDIDPQTGNDLRRGGTALRMLIYTGRTEGLRTYGTGGHVSEQSRSNSPWHEAIREDSPVQPGGVDGRVHGDLLFRNRLDRYLSYLNRHPGRKVDLSVTPTREPGGVYVDYLVAEDRPWTVYAQWANTGTDATTKNRQRVGFQHTQLTGNDDILQLDYVTGDFDDVNAALGSYEMALAGLERTRARVEASWSEYNASQFGLPDAFEGRQVNAGVSLIRNLYQDNDLFIDVAAGARYMYIETDEDLPGTARRSEDADYFVPRLGARVEQLRNTSSLLGSLELERNFGGDDPSLLELGRNDMDKNWTRLAWQGSYRFYLEPILYGRRWKDARTPSSSTLAHEIYLRTQGQYSFGTRLIPQAQQVFGGLYSVRGYPQSVLASDDGLLLSAEYRFHLPRYLRPRPASQLPLLGSFRVAPDRVFGRPDWDLALRVFFDWARAGYSDAVAGEEDQTLSGYGVGFELAYSRYLIFRLDYAIAGSDYRDVEQGDRETYFVTTIRY